MTINGLAQIGLFFLVLMALVKPLGWYVSTRARPAEWIG